MRVRLLGWAAIGAAVVLLTRVLVYALVPQSLLVAQLAHKTGNPHVLVAALSGAGVAILIAVALVWLAFVAVRERLALEGRRAVEVARPSIRRLVLRAVALGGASSVAFAYFESYIHWREGLGWHGLDCLLGPVHRNAIPILVALSILAVALHAAIEHLVAWTRRVVTTLAARVPLTPHAPVVFGGVVRAPLTRLRFSLGSPRGPPQALVPVLSI